MKTIINNNEIDNKTHPYLGIADDGTIVLFIKKDTGFCLHSGSKNQNFEYADFWEEDEFKVFNGEITLSN